MEHNLDILLNYFKHLSLFGYLNDKETERVLIYCFLIEFIQKYEEYMGYEHLAIITKAMQCLENGSCIISPDPNSSESDLLSVVFGTNIRSSETNIIRRTQDFCYRTPAR